LRAVSERQFRLWLAMFLPLAPSCPGSGGGLISMLAANYGAVPLSPDQEFQAGFACNGVAAVAPNAANRAGVPVSSAAGVNICGATALTSGLVKIPAPNTENDDKNPPHVQPRNLFDLAIGDDNLFHGDKYRWSAQLMMINIANNDALYM
jgi:hypothetical protein